MSEIQLLKERVAALTALVNSITTNGKKIDELPPQTILNLASRLHVSRSGISERIDLQQIFTAILENTNNQIIAIGEITRVDNVLTIPSGAEWRISNVIYNTASDTIITVPYSAAGLIRTDILVANTNSEIVLIQGPETAGIGIRPNIPLNTILVTEINVTETTVGDPTQPITEPLFQYNKFKFIQKGFGNDDLTSYQIGDHFCGHSNDGTIRYTDAIWMGGPLNNSDSFKPLVQTEIS